MIYKTLLFTFEKLNIVLTSTFLFHCIQPPHSFTVGILDANMKYVGSSLVLAGLATAHSAVNWVVFDGVK